MTTSLRFVGDLPLWLGLLIAAVVALLAWRFYRRESHELPSRMQWVLPALRSAAFFLGIMLLTGPVLHHRETIGQLGKVQIYVDGSSSMTLRDRHMSSARKLQVAQQLGWITESGVPLESLELADDLATAGRLFRTSLESPAAPEEADDVRASNVAAAGEFATFLEEQFGRLDADQVNSLRDGPIRDLRRLIDADEPSLDEFLQVADLVSEFEDQLRADMEERLSERLNAQQSDVASAIALFDETPRWLRASMALADSPDAILESLREHHDIEVRTLFENAAELKAFEPPQLGDQPTTENEDPKVFGAYTDLSSGVTSNQTGETRQDAQDNEEDEVVTPIGREAIVLITDGQHNFGPSPLQLARVLGNQGKPFFTVSIGASTTAADLSVVDLDHPDLVFAKDRVQGILQIRDTMPSGTAFVAEIREGDNLLWQKELTTQGVGDRRISFEFDLADLAESQDQNLSSGVKQNILPLTLTASLTELPTEAESNNNAKASRLAAILQDHKVLILDGRSRWETRYLRNAFARDERWEVDTIIAGPGTELDSLPRGDQEDMFPTTRDQLFDYDLIIWGEIPVDLFTVQELDWVREFVERRGGGMILIDGNRKALRAFDERNLLGLVPIEWQDIDISSPPDDWQLTDRGTALPALRLVPEESENTRFWSKLPRPKRFVATEVIPGAEVLAEFVIKGQPYPAMVTRNYGSGRVLYLASDESWRWRYKAADKWHQRVWNQLAKFVMPQPFAVSDEYVELDSGPINYDEGSEVQIRARLKDLDGTPAPGRLVDALVWENDRIVATASLKDDPNVPGTYLGATEPLPAGDYEVTVRASGYTEEALPARTEFTVNAPAIGELSQTAANEELLEQVALASGGTALREEQIGQLPNLLKPLSSGRVVESETLLWQSYWWFVAILLLLTAEWILRKRTGLL